MSIATAFLARGDCPSELQPVTGPVTDPLNGASSHFYFCPNARDHSKHLVDGGLVAARRSENASGSNLVRPLPVEGQHIPDQALFQQPTTSPLTSMYAASTLCIGRD